LRNKLAHCVGLRRFAGGSAAGLPMGLGVFSNVTLSLRSQ
jgi:hypothetical protein